MRTERRKQQDLLAAMRNHEYLLNKAIEVAKLSKRTFRSWYIHDDNFRREFDLLEDEQMVFLRQEMREMASGVHPAADGKPDKSLMRFLLNDYTKRHGAVRLDLSDEELALLGDLDDIEQDGAAQGDSGEEEGES